MITTKHNAPRPADLQALDAAVTRLELDAVPYNRCQVALFEIPGDRHLHVNVTHRFRTISPKGWAGPGELPGGFVHNRRFADARPAYVSRQIREMVFADRID